jgi:putative membrane protein insertion efficiency factor
MISRLLDLLLRGYKRFISPCLPQACRYLPTCSEYMREAVQVHGPVKGVWLGTRRLCRCHPWGGHGYDPVPPKK